MAKTSTGFLILWVVLVGGQSKADVGVFTGSGQDLRQISTSAVQLVSIDVTIVPGRGRFLFDGTVPGMDQVEYYCQFQLRNLTDKACDVQVGFPIDSQFARLPDPKEDGRQWISSYSFIARDDKTTYNVGFQRVEAKEGERTRRPFSAIFLWTMSFQGNESKTLSVQYRIPMSLTLASASKRGIGAVPVEKELPWVGLLDTCLLEIIGYTTETGSSWSGNVEKASFTLVTEPFERYLNHRGFQDEMPDDSPAEAQERMKNSFPVAHGWWYREIKLEGWKPVKGGVRWEYKDFKPKDPITIGYFLMQYPLLAVEVDPWVDALLRRVEPGKQAEALLTIEQVLTATYGKEPVDPVARAFAEDQIWYHPSKDFSLQSLTAEQRAVLKALHKRQRQAEK